MKKMLLILSLILPLGSVVPATAAGASDNAVSRFETTVATAVGGNGRITFYAGNTDAVFHIYSITGQLLKTMRLSADGHASLDMPKGFYVVRCNGQWSRKVVVK